MHANVFLFVHQIYSHRYVIGKWRHCIVEKTFDQKNTLDLNSKIDGVQCCVIEKSFNKFCN